MYKFSYLNRESLLRNVSEETYDIAVVGGGVTGAGVAREAALRGLKVCVLEKNDFSSGTSSRSSKLAHGGLRYLENFEFDLVSEALNERQHLLNMAPHMVRPLPFLIPIYKDDRVSWLKMKCGMILYDILVGLRAPKLHRSISKKEILKNYPEIKGEGLKGGFVYYDALMDDDRLVLETLRDASRKGVHALSYVEVTGFEKDKNKVQKLVCKDSIKGESFEVSAKHVISCTGPWTDSFAKKVDSAWNDKMRPSKGIHLCIPKSFLNLKTALVMAADKSKRILFCIPREDFDIIGTTDTDYEGDPSQVYSQKADIDYVLKVLKDYYPEVKITYDDILATYAGVRPLVNDGSDNESKVSRTHWICSDVNHDITYVSGGKYTTYLSMAKETVKQALKSNRDLKPSNGGSEYLRRRPFVLENTPENNELALKRIQERPLTWSDSQKEDFVHAHGAEAIRFLDKYPNTKNYLELEALIAIEEYCCGSLVDLYTRRTTWALGRKYLKDHDFKSVSKPFKDKLEMSQIKIQEEIDTIRSLPLYQN